MESMKLITINESHQVMAALATNTNWEEIDSATYLRLKDQFNRDPTGAGKLFIEFLKRGCRSLLSVPKIILIRPFNPVELIGADWSIWKGSADGDGLTGEEDIDSRSLALTVIDPTTFLFETCLEGDEEPISGEERLRRLKAKLEFVRFGSNNFIGLWKDYLVNPENSVLEWIYWTLGINYMDFMGLVLRNPYGSRYVLFFCRRDCGDRWWYGYYWLKYSRSAADPSVGCAISNLK